MIHMSQKHPIDQAADILDGAGKLAALLGVSAQAISNWKERGVPIDRCLAIERATDGKIGRRELREDWADIWPELKGAGAPAAAPAHRSKPKRTARNEHSNTHRER
jgi:DNA-binding transcriptional regulator YdaS (Cro superfamily)